MYCIAVKTSVGLTSQLLQPITKSRTCQQTLKPQTNRPFAWSDPITWYKITHADEQVVNLFWRSATSSSVCWFCIMWPDRAKGLLALLYNVHECGLQCSFLPPSWLLSCYTIAFCTYIVFLMLTATLYMYLSFAVVTKIVWMKIWINANSDNLILTLYAVKYRLKLLKINNRHSILYFSIPDLELFATRSSIPNHSQHEYECTIIKIPRYIYYSCQATTSCEGKDVQFKL